MKKLVFFVLALLLGLASTSAQQHLKFMGIPIDGNIENFTAKLKAKGLTIHPDNKTLTEPVRAFKGVFFDHEATIWAHYTRKNRTVYRVTVRICKNSSKEVCKNVKEQIEDVIQSKYQTEYKEGESMGGDKLDMYNIFNNDDECLGQIYLGIYSNNLFDGYYLIITYEDMVNNLKEIESKEEDI